MKFQSATLLIHIGDVETVSHFLTGWERKVQSVTNHKPYTLLLLILEVA